MFDSLMAWLKGVFEDVLQWILDALLWVPKKLWAELLEAFSSLVSAIPVPSFVSNAGNFFADLPSGVVYFLNFFAIQEGIAMLLSALVLRFIIRRIPVIG